MSAAVSPSEVDLRIAFELAKQAPVVPTAVPAVDVYGAIHKGLRYCLCELVTRIGTTSPEDGAGVQRIFDDLEGALYLLDAHAEHEQRHLHAALEARRAGGSAPFVASHEALDQRTRELRALVHTYAAAAPDTRAAAWRTFYLRFASFAALELVHMSDEEERAQPLLDALYPPDELRAIHFALLGEIGPEERVAALRIMLLGATPDERELLIAGARARLPASVVTTLVEAPPRSAGAGTTAPRARSENP